MSRPRTIAIVAARGGSKGLPGKNVAACGGKPLVAWTVEAALGARRVDKTVISSDDPVIIEVARQVGAEVPFVRPDHLATDSSTMADVVLHALDHAGDRYGTGVLLQATSPLRLAADIDAALACMESARAPSVVSITEPAKSPYWMSTLTGDGRVHPLFPAEYMSRTRQELPRAYVFNGAIYAFDVAWFRKNQRFVTDETVAYVMPQNRSVDIDTALDLALADLILRGNTVRTE